MRLIDADALWEIVREKQNSLTARCGGYRFLDDEDRAKYDRLEITLAYIENAPEADAVPVVRGEWVQKHHIISLNNMTLTGTYPTCNLCGYAEVGMAKNTNYCPNCGAKMEDKP